MAKKGNASEGVRLPLTISKQSAEALEQLAARGIFGRNASDVAARFVDKALQEFVKFPPIELKVGEKEK